MDALELILDRLSAVIGDAIVDIDSLSFSSAVAIVIFSAVFSPVFRFAFEPRSTASFQMSFVRDESPILPLLPWETMVTGARMNSASAPTRIRAKRSAMGRAMGTAGIADGGGRGV